MERIEDFFSGENTEEIQIKFAVPFGVFGVLVFTVYGTINMFTGGRWDVPTGIFEYVLAIITFVITYVTYTTKSIEFARRYAMIPVVAITLHNFNIGGFTGEGILWSYVFPSVAVFLTGKRTGTTLTIGILLFTVVLYILGLTGNYDFKYGNIFYITYLVSMFSLLLMTVIIHAAWDRAEETLIEQREELDNKRIALEAEIHSVLKAEEEAQLAIKKMKEQQALVDGRPQTE